MKRLALTEGVTRVVLQSGDVESFEPVVFSDTTGTFLTQADFCCRERPVYRLDSAGAVGGGAKADLGPLPGTAKALLGGIGAAWVLLGGYYALRLRRKKKRLKKQ